MVRLDKQTRSYKVHPDHVTAAHSERVGKLKAERANDYRAIHASGAHVAARPIDGRARALKKPTTG